MLVQLFIVGPHHLLGLAFFFRGCLIFLLLDLTLSDSDCLIPQLEVSDSDCVEQVAEISRILRPGGMFVATTYILDVPYPLMPFVSPIREVCIQFLWIVNKIQF